MKPKTCLSDDIIEEFIGLHMDVLRRVLLGCAFEEIERSLSAKFEKLNYEVLASFFSLLHFNERGQLDRAYPISPVQTPISICVEGIGSGYAMCAIDSLGVAFLFGAKTEINSVDAESGNPIRFTIDPYKTRPRRFADIVVSLPMTVEDAAFCCPHVLFLSSNGRGDLSESTITFEEALEYGKTFFSRDNMSEKLKSKLLPLLHIYDSGKLTRDILIRTINSGRRFSLLGSLFPDEYGRLIVEVLSARRVIHKTKNEDGEFLDLTPKGKRIVETFRFR
ncbi:MAG: hypothetical protein JSW61_10835 [Candidatus Thorarchaeota archaeon]|nr:MAG: hypothetical protein JSW61_10835 [Candidatus Thorarchaeota archaeon]